MKESTRGSLQRYAEQGVPPGGFLKAVLENNLMEAFGRADVENTRDMVEILSYVYNNMPFPCHGSPEKVAKWLGKKELHNEHTRNER